MTKQLAARMRVLLIARDEFALAGAGYSLSGQYEVLQLVNDG